MQTGEEERVKGKGHEKETIYFTNNILMVT